ncbi:MAG: outer membrane protein assembly factor BamA [Deltaproteobacteria bacterium]|jgi:outer membrane protein insertion porin family|nr:outer membrane protein assembly factor BamA [Deltaproteobacteria bacterium]
MPKKPLVFIFFGCLLMMVMAAQAWGQAGQKIAVAPYQVVGVTGTQLEQLSNISRGLLELTVAAFQAQGFQPVAMGAQTLSQGGSAVVAQAKQLGADFLFWPDLTRSGTTFNLSGQLQALSPGLVGSRRMSVASTASENLPQTAERLVLMVTDHLFGGGATVLSVSIAGSGLVENAAILNSLRIRKGGTYNEAKAASDIRRLHSMGYFESVSVEVDDVKGGKEVRFRVTERPQIGVIVYQGNKKFDADDLNKIVGLKQLDLATDDRLGAAVSNLRKFYSDKGYPMAQITYELQPGDDGKAKLVFQIVEGGKLYIRDIRFEGNKFYSNWKLKGQIESKTRFFLTSWLTGSGKLDRDKLANDAQTLTQFYHNNGFLLARVGEPSVEGKEGTDGYRVTFPISEGQRYRVGAVTLTGALLATDVPKEILKLVELRREKWFNREMLQEDINRVKNYYADKGYARNEVEAIFGEPDEKNFLPVALNVNPKTLVYYDRITIVGNDKTRDKVIRRHLEFSEGDLTSNTKLKDSQANLMRSSFFEDINLVPSPSDKDDMMNLRVEVKERPTGSFQIGAGYSNYNSIFGTIRLTQDNLFGYGRRVALEANIGSESNYFNFSFTDPWVGDIPLMMGVDLFKYYNNYDYYRKDARGVAVRAGYPVFERFYLTGTYSWENVEITDVGLQSSRYLTDMMGHSINSHFTIALRRDTRNHFFQPTSGSTARVSYTIASALLGGDTSFNRYEIEYAKWVPMPLFKNVALMGHIEVGLVKENKKGGLPVYEKYMIGGINSLRGYDWYDVSPKDPLTEENIGGEKMMVMNFELTFPLIKDSGLFAVGFYDMGNVWSKDDSYSFTDLKRSYGGGLRYLSPMGPLRIEYGRALDPEPGDPSGRWEFTMGAMF